MVLNCICQFVRIHQVDQITKQKMLRLRCLLKIPKRNVSALYITPDKGSEHTTVLEPYLDFESRLSNRELLEANVCRRGLSATTNLKDIYNLYDLHTTVIRKREVMENRRKDITDHIKKLLKDKDQEKAVSTEELMRKYKMEGSLLRDDIKGLNEHGYLIEDKFIHAYLALPNDIHAKSPDTLSVISSVGEPSNSKTPHHLTYDTYVDYFDDTAYYLKHDVAKFDLHFPLYCIDRFRKGGFSLFSNPDFVRSILVEGAGTPLNEVYEIKHETNTDDVNVLHLVGNGSMKSYLGFITKLTVAQSLFPLRFISMGKQYVPSETNELGLYGVSQSNAVQIFCAGTENHIENELKSILDAVNELYKSLDLHFRIVYVSPSELKPAESLCIRIQMQSRHYGRYIDVGNLSLYSDFISKRLLFNYKEGKEYRFPHILSGTICNVTRIIAILLEESSGNFSVHQNIANFVA